MVEGPVTGPATPPTDEALSADDTLSPPGEGGGRPEATLEAEGDGVLSSLEMLAAASANRQ